MSCRGRKACAPKIQSQNWITLLQRTASSGHGDEACVFCRLPRVLALPQFYVCPSTFTANVSSRGHFDYP
jgi:hypothetical protein